MRNYDWEPLTTHQLAARLMEQPDLPVILEGAPAKDIMYELIDTHWAPRILDDFKSDATERTYPRVVSLRTY